MLSVEARAKISAANRGRIKTPETRAKLSAAFRGRLLTSEHRARVSAALLATAARRRAVETEWKCGHPRTPENTSAKTPGRPHGCCRSCESIRDSIKSWRKSGVDPSFTWDDYKRMEAEQGGRCKICGRVPTKHLDLDHDHDRQGEKGNVRGLLCWPCNKDIGKYEMMKRSGRLVEFQKYLDAARV